MQALLNKLASERMMQPRECTRSLYMVPAHTLLSKALQSIELDSVAAFLSCLLNSTRLLLSFLVFWGQPGPA